MYLLYFCASVLNPQHYELLGLYGGQVTRASLKVVEQKAVVELSTLCHEYWDAVDYDENRVKELMKTGPLSQFGGVLFNRNSKEDYLVGIPHDGNLVVGEVLRPCVVTVERFVKYYPRDWHVNKIRFLPPITAKWKLISEEEQLSKSENPQLHERLHRKNQLQSWSQQRSDIQNKLFALNSRLSFLKSCEKELTEIIQPLRQKLDKLALDERLNMELLHWEELRRLHEQRLEELRLHNIQQQQQAEQQAARQREEEERQRKIQKQIQTPTQIKKKKTSNKPKFR